MEKTFLWHDLITHDIPRATVFYGELFNWKVRAVESPQGLVYSMISVGDRDIGGFLPPPQPGVQSHWLPYVATDSIDNSCEQIRRLDGRVEQSGTDIPSIGRYALFSDNQGAYAALLRLDEPTEARKAVPGEFCWHGLVVPDTTLARSFWGRLLGWTCTDIDLGGGIIHEVFNTSGERFAGLNRQAVGTSPAHWRSYVLVEDLSATHSRALRHGATSLMDPSAVGHIGQQSMLSDPTGALVCLFESAAD